MSCIYESYDVWMSWLRQSTPQLNLIFDQNLSLFTLDIHFLQSKFLSCLDISHLVNIGKATFSQLFINLKLLRAHLHYLGFLNCLLASFHFIFQGIRDASKCIFYVREIHILPIEIIIYQNILIFFS